MFLKAIKLQNLTGIGAGNKCTMPLPNRNIYHGIYLVCRSVAAVGLTRAQIIADVGNIKLVIDGDTRHDSSALLYLDDFKYFRDKDGALTVAGVIPIDLTRPFLQSAAERSLVGWGMQDVTSFTLEVDITAVAVLSTIEVWALVEEGSRPLGRHICISRFTDTFATTGLQQKTNLPFGQADNAILVDHIYEAAGAVDSINVVDNSTQLLATIPFEFNTMLQKAAGRTTQAGIYSVDYALINDAAGYLPSGKLSSLRYDIMWNVAAGAPGTYNIYRLEVRGMTKPVM